MKINFTKDSEKERVELQRQQRESKGSWELFKSTSIATAVRVAESMGWAENKVQVKQYRIADDQMEFHIEPFEKDCGCAGLLKYKDFFGTPDTSR